MHCSIGRPRLWTPSCTLWKAINVSAAKLVEVISLLTENPLSTCDWPCDNVKRSLTKDHNSSNLGFFPRWVNRNVSSSSSMWLNAENSCMSSNFSNKCFVLSHNWITVISTSLFQIHQLFKQFSHFICGFIWMSCHIFWIQAHNISHNWILQRAPV